MFKLLLIPFFLISLLSVSHAFQVEEVESETAKYLLLFFDLEIYSSGKQTQKVSNIPASIEIVTRKDRND